MLPRARSIAIEINLMISTRTKQCVKKDKEDFLGLEDACPSVFFSGKSIFCMRKTEVSFTVLPLKPMYQYLFP